MYTMWRNRTLGALILVGGTVLLNLTYLGDLIFDKPGGIILGPKSGMAIVIANIAIVVALLMMIAQRPPPKQAGPGEESEN